jgi:Na+-driven multidrug efflux pump
MNLGISGAALASTVAFWGYAAALLWLMHRLTGLPLLGVLRKPSREDHVVRLLLGRLRARAADEVGPVSSLPPQ